MNRDGIPDGDGRDHQHGDLHVRAFAALDAIHAKLKRAELAVLLADAVDAALKVKEVELAARLRDEFEQTMREVEA